MTKMMRFGWVEFRKPFVCILAIRIGYKGRRTVMFSLRGIAICGTSRILIAKWRPFEFSMMKPRS